MGAASSSQIDTPQLLDAIFKYLTSELGIRDLTSLSNYTECKKYVTFMANDLHKYFYEMKIFIDSGPKGVLAFRKVDDLVNPPTEKDITKQKSLCVVIAYFYARIFQVYGAIALTLIDDIEYVDKMLGRKKVVQAQGVPGVLYAPGHSLYIRPQKGGNQYGGANKELVYYKCLSAFLDENVYEAVRGYKAKYTLTDDTRGEIFFMPDSPSDTQKGTFRIRYPNSTKQYYLDVSIQQIDSKYMLRFISLYYKDDSNTKFPRPSFIIDTRLEIKQSGESYIISGDPVPNVLTKLFSRLIREIKENDKTKDLYDTKYRRDVKDPWNTKNPWNTKSTDTQIEEISIRRVYENLNRVRPQAHCIARAMQLLTTAPFTRETVSNICRSRFLERDDKTERSGIPKKGEAISDSPGLYVLSQLFYDTISSVSPKIIIGKESSFNHYIKFMKTMATRFGDIRDDKDKERDIKSYDNGLKAITDRRDARLCKSYDDTGIYITDDAKPQVMAVVKDLISMQESHALKCHDILNDLFLIRTDSSKISVSLHPNIIQGGFDVLNRITYKTRSLLMDYYERCEKRYIDGMEIVLDNVDKTRSASTKTFENRGFINTLRREKVSAPIFPNQVLPSAPAPAPAPSPSASAPVPIVPAPVAPAPAPVAPALKRTSNLGNQTKAFLKKPLIAPISHNITIKASNAKNKATTIKANPANPRK